MAKDKGGRAKVVIKSLSWAAVSGVIIFLTAWLETGMYKAALITALVSVLLKTPFYSVHEVVFDAVWHRKGNKVQAHAETGADDATDAQPIRLAS